MPSPTLVLVVCSTLFIVEPQDAPSPGSVASREEPQLESFFPDPASLREGMRAESFAEYDRKTLYDYIDGGAEVYLGLGFRRVGTRDYVVTLEEETYFTLDVYDMAKPVNAFAVYRVERPPEAAPVKAGVEGWRGGGALCFWAGPYYVKIRADGEGKAVDSLLVKMARLVAARLGSPGRLPPELLLFPGSPYKVPCSEKYVTGGLLGLEALKGFSCAYRGKGAELDLYACPFPSQKEAEQAEKAFAKRLSPAPRPAEEGLGLRFTDKRIGRGRCLRVGAYFSVAIYKPSRKQGTQGAAPWMDKTVLDFFDRITEAAMKDKTDKALKALMGGGK